MPSTEQGFLLTVMVAAGAGFIRGFTGFGGPAFMLAILTWFHSPLQVIGKILVIELISSSYLAYKIRQDIDWRATLSIVIPTLLLMPAGHWVLTQTDPQIMQRIIGAVTLISCVLMLLGYRYKKRLTLTGCIALGIVSGLVFGATYIALVFVVFILMGPYNKSETRSLLISWGFLTALWFAGISVITGNTNLQNVIDALSPAASYFIGTWVGSRLFDQSGESLYRTFAIVTLIVLCTVGFFR